MKKVALILAMVMAVGLFGCVTSASELNLENEVTEYIAIPGITKIVFVSGELDQPVGDIDLYNPEENNCKIAYKLVLETGTVIWEGNPLPPGYRFHKIKLKEALPEGRYRGILQANCFDRANNPLNSCSFEVGIMVKGKENNK